MARKNKIENTFRITNLGITDEVTGTCVLVECDGQKILLDYGGYQSEGVTLKELYEIHKKKLDIDLTSIDTIICSHSHNDHVFSLGFLGNKNYGFNGKIYATTLCAELTNYILCNSADILSGECKTYNGMYGTHISPLYTKDDVGEVVRMIRGIGYEERVNLTDNLYFELLPSGHISGGAMIYLVYEKDGKVKRLLFTGDFYYNKNGEGKPFTKSVLNKCIKANCIITESTYANRLHDNRNPIDFLEEAIMNECVTNNKILWISSFAQHRATSIYYMLNEIFNRNQVVKNKNIPVYFCGRLMMDCHRTIGNKDYAEFYDDVWNDKREIFDKQPFGGFLVEGKDVERFIRNNSVKIVVSSAGMLSKGYSAKIGDWYIPNKKVSLLACGYQAPNSIGRDLLDGKKQVLLNGALKTARLKHGGIIPNMSCHADSQGIVDFIKSCNQKVLQKVVIIHGDKDARIELKDELEKQLNDRVEVIIPNNGDKIKF